MHHDWKWKIIMEWNIAFHVLSTNKFQGKLVKKKNHNIPHKISF